MNTADLQDVLNNLEKELEEDGIDKDNNNN
jgi:hypothetical protein